jgi:FMN reductase
MPLYQPGGEQRSHEARGLIEAVRQADGLFISAPGYHGALSGMVKNALDYLEDLRGDPRVYLDGLPVGCIAVASGWQAAVSTLHNLRTVVHALRGWPSPLGAALNSSEPIFDSSGSCLDISVRDQLTVIAGQVVEFARARAALHRETSERAGVHP